jgi:hypothetical protein
MYRHILAVSLASGALACLAGTAAQAESLSPGDERFKFVAGWFLPAFDTDVRFDDTDSEGDNVSLGDDLGLDQDQSGALIGFEWRSRSATRFIRSTPRSARNGRST